MSCTTRIRGILNAIDKGPAAVELYHDQHGHKDKCLRCGKCCYFPQRFGLWAPCRYLRDGYCAIYKKRLGKMIGYGMVCTKREDVHYNIPGCPYNRPEWPNHPFFNAQGGK